MVDGRLAGTDLNLLVALDVLVSERSVTRAARRLGLGQPAMSATLARLRRLAGDPLLVRQGREMVPTARAESMAVPVREALRLLEHALVTTSTFDPVTDQRTFSVVASDYVTLVLLRPLLARLEREAPGVRLHVSPVTSTSGEEVRAGRVDLLIVPDDVLGPAPGLERSPLFEDRFVCAVAADHPHVGTTMSAEELGAQPYLAFDVRGLGSVAEEQLDALGIERGRELSVESFLVAPFLLHGTRFVSLLHERLARVVQEHLDLRVLEPPVPLGPITEVMAWTPVSTDDPGHAWLRARLQEVADGL